MKRTKTPTFLIELPLRLDWGQEHQVRGSLEAARCLYNALLGEANKRLHRMRSDPAWQEACAIPRTNKQERAQALAALRKPIALRANATLSACALCSTRAPQMAACSSGMSRSSPPSSTGVIRSCSTACATKSNRCA